jgi:hypothetical protein
MPIPQGRRRTLQLPADGQFQLLKGAEKDQVVTEDIRATAVGSILWGSQSTQLLCDLFPPPIQFLMAFWCSSVKPGELFALALSCTRNGSTYTSGEYFVGLEDKGIKSHQNALIINSILVPFEDSINAQAFQHKRAMVDVYTK